MKQLLLVVMASMLIVVNALAQKGIGAKYGTRDPQTCDSTKEPTKGAPSPALVEKYVACTVEGESGGMLYLIENVKVEIGKGTPWMELDRGARPSDGDKDGLVYPIRGSQDRYQCSQVSDYWKNRGKNCNVYHQTRATGTCYRTTFGDWHCNMSDLSAAQQPNVAPPPAK